MGISIYTTSNNTTDPVSEDGEFTNPLLVSLDGKNGGVLQKRLYLHNNSPTLSYSGIDLTVVDEVGFSVVDGEHGFSWKLREGDLQPTDEEWKVIDPGNEISFSGIGNDLVTDTSTYLPFWVRVEIPRNTSVQTITDVQFQLTGQEILV